MSDGPRTDAARYPDPVRERDYHPPRDCKHGQQARSCEVCELERQLAEKIDLCDKYAEALSDMTVERDGLRGDGEIGTSPYHDGPEECPTYYDGCNCSVKNLLGVREQMEAENERLTAERDALISGDILTWKESALAQQAAAHNFRDQRDALSAENERLRQGQMNQFEQMREENERLRALLRELWYFTDFAAMKKRIRAALEGE